MNVGQLTATYHLDASGAERGIAEAEMAMVGFQRDVDGRLHDMHGNAVAESEAIGRAIGEHIRAGVDESIGALHPDILVGADTRPADEDVDRLLARLEALRDARIGVDVPVEHAMAELESIQVELEHLATSHPDIDVQVNADAAIFSLGLTQEATERLERARPTVHVDVDAGHAVVELEAVAEAERHVGSEDGPARAGGAMSRLGQSVSGALGAIGPMAGTFSMVLGVIGAGVPIIAGLVSALLAIAPAAGVAVTGLFAVASAGAAIKIGTSGIGAALKAAFAPPAGGASAAVNTAQAIANAQLALKDTIQQTADANVLAARNVGDAQRTLADDVQAASNTQVQAERQVDAAERNLADAQKASLQAQLDLNAARKQAKMDMEDLSNQVKDATLSQRGDILAVGQAKIALDATMRSPGASAAMREQAQLTYDQAVQRLQEQGVALDRLKDKQAAATKAGVAGSALVVAAQGKVAAAQRTVGDQTQALTDAQVQAQTQVAAAFRKVGDQVRNVQDAQAAQAKTAYQGAEQVTKAQQALQQSAMAAAAAGVNPLAAAMAKLAPNARAFVREVMALGPAWTSLKLDVQQRLFDGLAGTLRTTAGTLLPIFHSSLVTTAGHLNAMAKGVGGAATQLGQSGVLGQALASANKGLGNMAGLPGQIVTGLGQIGAAAGPGFERITAGAGRVANKIADKMAAAFSSGGMQRAIDLAITLLGQLGTFVVNVGKVIGDVLGAAQQSGGGFVGTLVKVSGAMAAAFATPAVQSGLKALFSVMSTLASVAAPLLNQALQVIGPVLAALGPPVQVLIQALGAGLSSVVVALGPMLLAAAQAVGQLLVAVAPLLPVAGQLIAMLGPILTPILTAVGAIFQQLAPIVGELGTILGATLSPILANLPVLLQPFLGLITGLTGQLLPILNQLLVAAAPALTQVGASFGQIMVALAPVLTQLGTLISSCLQALMPLLPPIIMFVGQLAQMFAGQLASTVQRVVIPALQMLADLLSGNFSGAFRDMKTLVVGIIEEVIKQFILLPGEILIAIGDLAGKLYDAGSKIVSGLIDGIRSKIGDVKDVLSSLTDKIPSWKGPAARDKGLLSPAGGLIMDGLMTGISARVPALRGQLQGITAEIGGMAMGRFGGPQMAMAGGMGGSGMHIEHYYESDSGSAHGTATELNWLSKGRG